MLWALLKWIFCLKTLAESVTEMGPFYIKIAQIVTTRSDLFPLWLIRALRPLQDRVPAEKIDVEGELLASGSIAQVYLLNDGTILKQKRPGIEKRIESSEWILQFCALIPGSDSMLRVLKRDLRRHLDFEQEARNMLLMKRSFREDPDVLIPELYDYDSETIYMQRIPGESLRNLPETDRDWAIQLLMKKILKMIFDHGCVHGDPHEGNFLFFEHKVGFLDLGVIHKMTLQDQILLKLFFQSLFSGRIDLLSEIMSLGQKGDRETFERDLRELTSEKNLFWLLNRLLSIFQKNGFVVYEELLYPILVLIEIEGIVQEYSPDQSLMNLLQEECS